jgi:hypothetical protein
MIAATSCRQTYVYIAEDAILMEMKSDMKKRCLASPDSADAPALTFGLPVPVAKRGDMSTTAASEIIAAFT